MHIEIHVDRNPCRSKSVQIEYWAERNLCRSKNCRAKTVQIEIRADWKMFEIADRNPCRSKSVQIEIWADWNPCRLGKVQIEKRVYRNHTVHQIIITIFYHFFQSWYKLFKPYWLVVRKVIHYDMKRFSFRRIIFLVTFRENKSNKLS